jgi:hypothetical protein
VQMAAEGIVLIAPESNSFISTQPSFPKRR